MDLVFVCRKCDHHLFVESNEKLTIMLNKLPEYNCPKCGEEGYLNWIFSHIGDSEKEKDNYDWR